MFNTEIFGVRIKYSGLSCNPLLKIKKRLISIIIFNIHHYSILNKAKKDFFILKNFKISKFQ